MAKASRSAKLETRNARRKLKSNHEPYWVGIGRGLYLGYRKGITGGAWIARYYFGQKYNKQKLGKADDFQDANGIDVLDYFQAQANAREFADNKIKGTVGVNKGNFTVADAVNNYLDWFKAHRKSYSQTSLSVKTHILPTIGKLLVASVNTRIIREWHESLIKQPPRLRSSIVKQNYAAMPSTPDEMRARKVTANRVFSILRAALNQAWRDGLAQSDEAWRKVKPFRNVDSPRIRYLEIVECQRLINACDPDFRKLVRAALLTGCRYSELTKLKVSEFDNTNEKQKTIFISEAKNGKPRHIPLSPEGATFFETETMGKSGNELILMRDNGETWDTSHQARRLKEACERANIKPAISFHILRHTYGSLLASKGAPLQVIAALLGHSDTRITSKHYAHLMPSFVADTVRDNLPQFIIDEPQKVIKLKSVKIGGG